MPKYVLIPLLFRRSLCCGSQLHVLVSDSVTFHITLYADCFKAEWPPFGKGCSLGCWYVFFVLYNCILSYFPFWFREQDLGSAYSIS